MSTTRVWLAALLLLALAGFSTSSLANIPVIHHALLDATTATLTLDGENFGTSAGKVWLAKTPLTVQAWEDKKIIAVLPQGLAPGSHLVTIQTARLLPAFFVADLAGGSGTGDPGRISGTLSACGATPPRTLVYIPGRSYVVFTGLSGTFRLDSVPAGTYTVLMETPGQPLRVLQPITVNPGETTDLGTISLIDLNTNPNHCGACGNVCPGSTTNLPVCAQGTCQNAACPLGFANCDGNLANACETQIQTNLQNCGACGVVCAPGSQCVAGLCVGGGGGAISCSNDAFCPPLEFCDLAQLRCQLKGIGGMPCSGANQCQSGICNAGICQAAAPTCGPTMAFCAPTATCIPLGSPCPP